MTPTRSRPSLLSDSEVEELRDEAEAELTDRCTVQGLTWNADKNLWEPPYVVEDTNVPCSIASLSRLRDPNIATIVQSMNISFEAYRQVTLPVGRIEIKPDKQILKEPVTDTSARYQVVQAVQADETSPLTLILHCRKL